MVSGGVRIVVGHLILPMSGNILIMEVRKMARKRREENKDEVLVTVM